MNIFNDHKKLYPIAGILFAFLTFLVVILPALNNQKNNQPLPGTIPLTGDAKNGKLVYIAEGCVGCHSQQVRNVEMDKVFGNRPGMASDYANIGRTSILQNTATLMGTERTGPDLTDIGNRQPSKDWHLIHLFNPRILVQQSIMPAYKWLFEEKEQVNKNDIVVNVPSQYLSNPNYKIVATQKAIQLVAYIQSLKQVPLPTNIKSNEFLYKSTQDKDKKNVNNTDVATDGKTLYTNNCQSCHQVNGEGLKGSFPPLKGSQIINGENLELYVDIIMNGYDARPEYGVMSPIGSNLDFNENQVAAIINYERSSWGNNGKKVTPEEVKKVLDLVKLKSKN